MSENKSVHDSPSRLRIANDVTYPRAEYILKMRTKKDAFYCIDTFGVFPSVYLIVWESLT